MPAMTKPYLDIIMLKAFASWCLPGWLRGSLRLLPLLSLAIAPQPQSHPHPSLSLHCTARSCLQSLYPWPWEWLGGTGRDLDASHLLRESVQQLLVLLGRAVATKPGPLSYPEGRAELSSEMSSMPTILLPAHSQLVCLMQLLLSCQWPGWYAHWHALYEWTNEPRMPISLAQPSWRRV